MYAGLKWDALLLVLAGFAAFLAFVYGTFKSLERSKTTGRRYWWHYPAGFVVMVLGLPFTMDMWDEFFGSRPEERGEKHG